MGRKNNKNKVRNQENRVFNAGPNGPGNKFYTFSTGDVVGSSYAPRADYRDSGRSYEWHPADTSSGVKSHHTTMEYLDNCKRCKALGDAGQHPYN